MQQLTSILDYPDRGDGGKWNYRGNFSPRLVQDLVGFFRPKNVIDPMVGGGTTEDVCKQLGVPGWFGDLSRGFDIRADEIPQLADLVVVHPPYFDIVKYSGVMWSKGKPDSRDLSQVEDYPTFIKWLNEALYSAYQAVRPGGRLAVVIGDVKRKGVLYPIQRDMSWFGTPEYHLIKTQHNTWSGNYKDGQETARYSGKFIPLVHEHVIITRRGEIWFMGLRKTEISNYDLRNSRKMTWAAIFMSALQELGGKAHLTDIYERVRQHARVQDAEKSGTDWRAIIRQKAQFCAVPAGERGTWALPVAG